MKRREFLLTTATTAALSAVGVEAAAEPERRYPSSKEIFPPTKWEKGSSTLDVTKKLGRENGFDIEVVYTIPYEWTQFDDALMRTFTIVSSKADEDFIRTSVANTEEKPNVIVPNEVVLEQALEALKTSRDLGHILWFPDSYIFTHGELELDMSVEHVTNAGGRTIKAEEIRIDTKGEAVWWVCGRESWPKLWAEIYNFFLIIGHIHGAKAELRLVGEGMTLNYQGSGVRLRCQSNSGHDVNLPANA